MRWSEPGGLLAIGLVAALVSWSATRWAIRHAQARGLHDQPGERRSHAVPTPRGGGIGIALAGLGALLLLAAVDATPVGWLAMALGLALVAGIGWWDDHRPLPAWPRLLVHGLAASLLAFGLHAQGADEVGIVAGFLLGVGLVNVWNFMDGIDGMAVVQAVACALAFMALSLGDPAGLLTSLVLAAAGIAFLPANFPRARVFLGDVGSGALGYLVAILVARAFAASAWEVRPLLLLPLLAMVADAGLTLCWRLRHRQAWWQAHVEHAFQRWSRRSGHVPVTLAYAVWTLLASGFMLAWLDAGLAGGFLVLLAWSALAMAAWWRLHRRHDGRTEGLGA